MNKYNINEYRKINYGGSSCDTRELNAVVKSVKESIKSGGWQAGKQVALMEKEAADFLGVKYGILTTSGSCAGLLALQSLELPKGSEVIISATTFPTIFNIILQCSLIPVVVDSKIGTYNLDPDDLEAAISKKTKAIICVHALGNPVDMPKVMNIAKKHKLYVIEDNCDGWGTTLYGKQIGSYGDVSISSFHAAHIVSMGVGGGVFTSNKEIAEKVRMYRDWGRQANINKPNKYKELPQDYNPRFVYEKIGYNFQILELQAAMGRVQLRKAHKIKRLRKANFNYLYKHLSKFSDLILPVWNENADVCWFAFPITCSVQRGKLVTYLEERGIETRSLFSGNIIRHPAYKDSMYRISESLLEADFITSNSFWIGVHPRMTQADREYVVKAFEDFYARVT